MPMHQEHKRAESCNETDPPNYNLTKDDWMFYVYYYALLIGITTVNLLGNTMIIIAVIRHKRLRSSNNYFIISLAISDIVLGIAYTLYNSSHMRIQGLYDNLGMYFAFILSYIIMKI